MLKSSLVTHDPVAVIESCVNYESGMVRLRNARAYFSDITQDEIPLLVDLYSHWMHQDEYLVLKKTHVKTGESSGVAVLCAKRGNDVYAERIKHRLRFLKKHENLHFFHPTDFDTEKSVKTRLLWVTLTFDPAICSLEEAWQGQQIQRFKAFKSGGIQVFQDGRLGRLVSEHVKGCRCIQCTYNLWITNIRRHYGHVDVLRFIQGFPDDSGEAFGYPHLHLVLLFRDVEFQVFPWMEGDGSLSYRVYERDEIKASGNWHSFVDIKAIMSMAGVHQYAVRHHENAGFGDSEEALINNALCWLYRKRSFTISGDFRVSYSEFIDGALHNSKGFQRVFGVDGGLVEGKEGFHRVSDYVFSLVGVVSAVKVMVLKGFCCGSVPPWSVALALGDVDLLFDGHALQCRLADIETRLVESVPSCDADALESWLV